jgi:hypothetical protein
VIGSGPLFGLWGAHTSFGANYSGSVPEGIHYMFLGRYHPFDKMYPEVNSEQIADIDGDGYNEIIITSVNKEPYTYGNIYVFKTKGVAGNDPWPMWGQNPEHTAALPLTLGEPRSSLKLFNVQSGAVSANHATITWSTDGYSDSTVFYGTSLPYTQSAAVDGLVMSHSVSLSGLLPSTTYHYSVSSKDSFGNVNSSSDAMFTTLAGGTPPPSFYFNLNVSLVGAGDGRVASTPRGISCGTDCSEIYSSGTLVTLTATAALGSRFVGWSGDCTGNGVCNIVMNSNKSAGARFDALVTLFDCTGTAPLAGEGVTKGPSKYIEGYTPNQWTYTHALIVNDTTPCFWTCRDGFLPDHENGKIVGCRPENAPKVDASDFEVSKSSTIYTIKEADANNVLFVANSSDPDFLRKLNSSWIIRRNETEDVGYLIIVNLTLENATKLVYVKRNSSNSNTVRIADRDNVTSKEDILSDSISVSCPGSLGSYSCVVNGSWLIVSGLRHSGVIERYVAAPPPDDEDFYGDVQGFDIHGWTKKDAGGCTSNWSCSWSACIGGFQNYTCRDLKNCTTPTNKPQEYRGACGSQVTCVDNDGDGYGVGNGCIGSDLNDNDPAITTTLPGRGTPAGTNTTNQTGQGDSDKKLSAAIWVFSLVFAIVIVILFFMLIHFSRQSRITPEAFASPQPKQSWA